MSQITFKAKSNDSGFGEYSTNCVNHTECYDRPDYIYQFASGKDPSNCFPGLFRNRCATWDKRSCNSIGVDYAKVDSYGTCTYNIADFDTNQQIDNVIDKFQDPDVSPILKTMCAKQTDLQCPVDMEGKQQRMCSRMVSNAFPQCKSLNTQFNDMTEEVKNTFCTDFPDNYNCDCMNRTFIQSYKTAKKYYPINDKCWWLPCLSPTNNLIPESIERSDTCPSNICSQVIQIDNPKDLDVIISNNEFIQNCPQGGGGGGGGTSQPTPGAKNGLSIGIIIGIAAAIFIIIVVIIIYIIYKFSK